MLAVGRALMSRPRLLVMDEPSLGLAPVVVDEVFEVIESITAAGVSVLLVEQEVERALAVSSRAYVLVEGRIVASGSAETLRGSAELRSSVLGL
jgi:branched-chain amino acid transport system ATP-binding protein